MELVMKGFSQNIKQKARKKACTIIENMVSHKLNQRHLNRKIGDVVETLVVICEIIDWTGLRQQAGDWGMYWSNRLTDMGHRVWRAVRHPNFMIIWGKKEQQCGNMWALENKLVPVQPPCKVIKGPKNNTIISWCFCVEWCLKICFKSREERSFQWLWLGPGTTNIPDVRGQNLAPCSRQATAAQDHTGSLSDGGLRTCWKHQSLPECYCWPCPPVYDTV